LQLQNVAQHALYSKEPVFTEAVFQRVGS